MHEIRKTSLPHIPATVGCSDLVPFIIPTSWTATEVDAVMSETGAAERNGSRLHTLTPLYLLSDIYTMFYKGVSRGEPLRCITPRFRCHTGLHYTAPTV